MSVARAWWKESVVYQIYPRSFQDSNNDGIGDLPGIISRLDYIKSLGVDMLWLSPIFKSPNDDMGYDISDYRAIMPEFGTMSDFDAMLDGIHKRDMRLLLDLVVNHTSDEHPWFQQARQSKDNPFRDYYVWHPGIDGREPNNWKSFFGGSVWQLDPVTNEYYLHLFSKKQPDLNWNNQSVRTEIFDMMRFWLDKGVDGFRMDVINFLAKAPGFPDFPMPDDFAEKYIFAGKLYMNQPGIHEMIQHMRRETLSRYDAVSVGECHDITTDIAADYVHAYRKELDMMFLFEVMGAGRNLIKMKKTLRDYYNTLIPDGWFAITLNNHDSRRQVSRFGNDSRYRTESAKLLSLFLLSSPGTPFLFQGEELGMTDVTFDSIDDYRDIETLNVYNETMAKGLSESQALERARKGSRDNARTLMQWDGTANGGFSSGTPWIGVNPNYPDIHVKKQDTDPDSILAFYRKMIAFRKNTPCLVYGDFRLVDENNPDVYACLRTLDDQRYLVTCNFTSENTDFTLPLELQNSTIKPAITNYDNPEIGGNLRPWEAVVWQII